MKNILTYFCFFLLILLSLSTFSQKIIRGPYLQMGTSTSMMIRWRTDFSTATIVKYGTSLNSLNLSVSSSNQQTEHSTDLNNLTPNTKYFYSLETPSKVLQGGNSYFFITPPPINTTQKIRVWANGDCGNGLERQYKVRDAFLKTLGDNYLNLWILLGDNTYLGSDDAAYEQGFFSVYAKDKFLRQSPLYPATGNHDYDGSDRVIENPKAAYYSIFSLPTKGEAGGVPSGSKGYYSYNYGNIHFVALESEAIDKDNKKLYQNPNNQVDWLEKDLAANTQMWTVIYFHHPPFTKGSHDSDIEADLIAIRQNIVPIIEKYKVDLVLNGHSHAYERSKPMRGHYGFSKDFDEKKSVAETSSGKWDNSANSCPYTKNQAPMYIVAGSAGAYGYARDGYPHKAMYYSYVEKGGSLYFEVENNVLSAQFINEDALILDKFTMMKNVNQKQTLKLEANQKSIPLTASWKGSFNWLHDNSKTETVMVTPKVTTKYVVQDDQKCLQDEITVKVPSGYIIQDFNSTSTKSGLVIDWITAQENGITFFEIERQRQGGEYQSVVKINSKAKNQFSEKALSYRYLDQIHENNENVNYRIKITDNEGVSYYSNTKKVNTSLKIMD
jgi:acid phosphatase type 7